jgi:hypothetical protein
MRHSTCARIACLVALLAIAATVEATPILPADIAVGASVTGSFSFRVSSSPPDQDPSPLTGRYLVSDSTARMVVEIGGFAFPSDLDGLLVEVTNHSTFDFDFIQLIATGDQATFPFLTGLPRQNPSLDPLGFFALSFRFPATHLSSDAFPTSIDPLAADIGGPTPTGIYQRVDGVSRQSPTSVFPEWLFQFDIDPLTMNLVLHNGVLTGTYSGTVAFVRPGDSTPVAPIPEPSSMILVMSGLLMLRKMAARSDRNRLVRK